MKTIFITATNTNIGKTFVALKLIEEFQKQGLKVGVFKPIETGVVHLPEDGNALKIASNFEAPLETIVPYPFALPAAPIVAKGEQTIDFEWLKTIQLQLQSMCDVLIVEGAGGVMTPVEKGFYMKDFAKLFEAKVLLVGGGYLGSISDVMCARYILEHEGIEHIWAINAKATDTDFERISQPFYDAPLLVGRDIATIVKQLNT